MNTTMDDGQEAAMATDPVRTETVGATLAAAMAGIDVSTVVCWDSSEDAMLAHVVARELGAHLVLAVEIEGIVSLLHPLAEDARVALVAEEFPARTGLAGLAGVVRHAGGRVAVVGLVTGAVDVAGTEAADARVVRPEAR